MPAAEELDGLLSEVGLTAHFGGWRAVEGADGVRSRSTRVATLQSAREMDAERVTQVSTALENWTVATLEK
jgi:hypothetical protein